jgi:hypothetical protein
MNIPLQIERTYPGVWPDRRITAPCFRDDGVKSHRDYTPLRSFQSVAKNEPTLSDNTRQVMYNYEFPTFLGFDAELNDSDYAEQETLDGQHPTTEDLK